MRPPSLLPDAVRGEPSGFAQDRLGEGAMKLLMVGCVSLHPPYACCHSPCRAWGRLCGSRNPTGDCFAVLAMTWGRGLAMIQGG
ncbi:MAG: hypothetical protein MUP21_08110 [Dehalococcoidia bacterium]|nr:hypothetical protein [Dehalococcoidia bacterium]